MTPPPLQTVEGWCWQLVHAQTLEGKLSPPSPPAADADSGWDSDPEPRRCLAPGRPPELQLAAKAPRTPRPEALGDVNARARLVHTFLHHELQAAELFAWAVLAFPETPREFRAGLVRLAREELKHLAMYARHLERLGRAIGDYPVRDWFWEKVTACREPAEFVAFLGLGLEGANLEHNERFAAGFRAAGDEAGARVLEAIGAEEISHVAFAIQWFEHFTGEALDYDRWRESLPPPLTPAVLQGKPLHREARLAAGLDEAFLTRLESEPPTTRPSSRRVERTR